MKLNTNTLCTMAAVLMAACSAGSSLRAQETGTESESAGFRVGGGATLSGEFYEMDESPGGSVPSRRPPSLVRLLLRLDLSWGDAISLPFSLMLTSRETNVVTPISTAPSLAQTLLNPLNGISLSPQIDWATFHLGSHTQLFSELSGGDVQIFGGGVDLRPGDFRFAASAGLIQRAIEVDTAAGNRGAFARRYYAVKLGYGVEGEGANVALNLIRTEDDPGSIGYRERSYVVPLDSADPSLVDTVNERHPLMPTPSEGILASVVAGATIVEGISLSGELAASAYTRDMTAPTISTEIPVVGSLIDVRTSTRADYAGNVALRVSQPWWGIDAKALYIGPGFVALGFPFMASDRLDITVSPRLILFDGDLSLNGTFGHRVNNLMETMAARTTQVLAGGSVQAQITGALSLAADYTNFGMRNTITNDTFKLESVAQSFSVTPTLSFEAGAINHTVTATLALDDFTDFNTVTGALNDNVTRVIIGTYSAGFADIPLSLDLTASTLTNRMTAGDLLVNGASLGASYSLLDGKLTPSLSVGATASRLGDDTDDTMLHGRLAVSWRIMERLRFNLALSTADMTYGSSRPGVSFLENYLQTSLSVNF